MFPEVPKPIINMDEAPTMEFGRGDKFLARLARLGTHIGAKDLGCMLITVPPGKCAFPFHAHHANEEMFIILQGIGEYRVGRLSYPVRPGDVIAAPSGKAETAHQIRNVGDSILKYLAISTMNDPDVVEYPDSGKFLVMSKIPEDRDLAKAGIRYIGRSENSLDYWDGETDDEPSNS